MSSVIRKPFLYIIEKKVADQLCGNQAANQHICFHYIGGTIPLLPKLKPPAMCCERTVQFVQDLVGNPEHRFSCDVAHVILATNYKGANQTAQMHREFLHYVSEFTMEAKKLSIKTFSSVLRDSLRQVPSVFCSKYLK